MRLPWILILVAAAMEMLPPAEATAQQRQSPLAIQQQRRYFTTSFSLEDVNLARVQGWLARVGLEIPVALGGEASIDVEVDVPVTALTSGRLYRVRGTASARRLMIDGLEVRNVATNIRYANGVATLQQLRFRIPTDGEDEQVDAAGIVTGQAVLQLAPLGGLIVEASLDAVPVGPLLAIFPELEGLAEGRVSGKVQAEVPLDQFGQIAAWEASGLLSTSRLQGYGVLIDQGVAEAVLQDGRLTLEGVRAELLGGMAQGSGTLLFTGEQSFSLRANWMDGDVEALAERLPEGTLPLAVRGEVAATIAAEGTLAPLKYAAAGELRAEPLLLGDYPIPLVAFGYRLDTSQLVLRNLVVETPRGRISGSAAVPFDPEQGAELELELAQVRLVPIADELLGLAIPPAWELAGMLSGRISAEIPVSAWQEIGQWQAQGELIVSDLRALERAGGIVSNIRLADGEVTLSGLRAELGRAVFVGSVRFALAAPFAFSVDAELAGGNLAALDQLPPPWRPPVPMSGLLQVAAEVAGSLNPLRLEGAASISARDVLASTLRFPQADVRLEFDGGQVEVTELFAQIGAGQVRGTATIPLHAMQGLEASLQWQSLDLRPWSAALARIYDDLPPGLVAGTADGRIDLTIPAGTFDQPARWSGSGEVMLRDFAALLWDFDRVEAAFRVADGTAEVLRFLAAEERERLSGSFTAKLTAPYPFSAAVSWEQGDFRNLGQTALGEALSALDLSGRFDLTTRVSGAFSPWELTGQGSLAARDVQLNGLLIDEASVDYTLDEELLRLDNLHSRIYGGTAEGSVAIPLGAADAEDADAPAQGSLAWQDVRFAPLVEALSEEELPLRGVLTGELVAEVPLPRWSELSAWQAELAFLLTELQSEAGQSLGSLQGTATLQENVLQYQAEGAVLGGQTKLAGAWAGIATAYDRPAAAAGRAVDLPPPAPPGPNAGQLQLQNVRLEPLVALMPGLELPEGWEAAIDLEFRYEHSRQLGISAGRGEVAISNLRHDDRLLVERLQGSVFLTEGALELRGLAGRFAEGRLQLAVVAPRSGGATSFSVALSRANVSGVLGFWPEWAGVLDGRADLRLRASFDERWRISATATWLQAEVAETDVGRWRLAILAEYDPASGRAYLRFRNVNGHWARGRVSGRGELTLGRRVQLSGQARFSQLDLQQLLRSLGISSRIGTGRVSGTLAFGGRNLRGLADLTAELDAELANTTATAIPFMRQLQAYLAPVIVASTTFDEGRLQGRLSRGVFYVQRVLLSSQAAQLFGTGTITTAGRLNLEVTANTGGLEQNQVLARTLLESLIEVSQPPVALLLRANEFLSDRVIHLQITGTWNAPVIRIRPARILAEEAARFFLQQAVQ